MHDGVTAVYKSNVDLFFCVLGAQNENEVRLVLTYNCVYIVDSFCTGLPPPHTHTHTLHLPAVDAGWCSKCSL